MKARQLLPARLCFWLPLFFGCSQGYPMIYRRAWAHVPTGPFAVLIVCAGIKLAREAKINPRMICAMVKIYDLRFCAFHGTDVSGTGGCRERRGEKHCAGCEATIYMSLTARQTSKFHGYFRRPSKNRLVSRGSIRYLVLTCCK